MRLPPAEFLLAQFRRQNDDVGPTEDAVLRERAHSGSQNQGMLTDTNLQAFQEKSERKLELLVMTTS